MNDGRPEPPYSGSERAQAIGFLEFLRATVTLKTSGLTDEQLTRTHPPSTMTPAGMLKHLAFVEDWWSTHKFLGHPQLEPWTEVDWRVDRDWDWRTALDDPPEELRALWEASVARSRAIIDAADFEDLSVATFRNGERFSMRWMVLHLIEEYARHCGHLDLIRESIDGATGQ